jgi:hypothetical protein
MDDAADVKTIALMGAPAEDPCLDHGFNLLQLGSGEIGHHCDVPVTQHSQSNVITILDSQSQGLCQLSDDILLPYPFDGG